MKSSLFKPHGTAEVEVSDAILTVHMHSTWNIEMRDQTSGQMRGQVTALNAAGPWGIINYLHDTLVYSEEVFAGSRQDYAARPPSSRMVAVAFVIEPGAEGDTLLKHRFETLLEGVITSQVFSDYATARQWMLDCIAAQKGKDS